MASTNFKLFDENKTNMMSDTEYNINTQRLNGVQAGIASSQLQNKTLYQTSLVAYSLAQIMMQNGYDANDSSAVSAFVGNMSNSLLQKVLDKATSAEAKAGTLTNKWMSPALVKSAIDYKFANAVTFGGTVALAGDPVEPLQAATKQYVDKSTSDPYDLKWKLYDKLDIVAATSSSAVDKTFTFTKEINGPVTEVMYHMHLVHLTSTMYRGSFKRLCILSTNTPIIDFNRTGVTIPSEEEDVYTILQVSKSSASGSSLGQNLQTQYLNNLLNLFTSSDMHSGFIHSNIIFTSYYVGCGAGSYIELLYR